MKGIVQRKYKKAVLLFLKFGITGTLIYWLLSNVDIDTVSKIALSVDFNLIVTAIVIHVAAFIVGCLRWWLLLKHSVASTRFPDILPSYYLGIFCNNILPTGIGGDVVRIVRLKLRGLNAKALISSTLMDRIIGLIVVMLMGAISIMLSSELNIDNNSKIYLVFILLVAAGIVMLLITRRFTVLIKLLHRKYKRTRIRGGIFEFIKLCHSYLSARGLIVAVASLSVIMQSMMILTYYILGRSIGVEVALITYFAVIPIVFLSASLPISLGGLGVREGVLVGLFVTANVDIHVALTLSLLYLLVLWLASVPGAFVFLSNLQGKKLAHAVIDKS